VYSSKFGHIISNTFIDGSVVFFEYMLLKNLKKLCLGRTPPVSMGRLEVRPLLHPPEKLLYRSFLLIKDSFINFDGKVAVYYDDLNGNILKIKI